MPLAALVAPESSAFHLSAYAMTLTGKLMCYAIAALAQAPQDRHLPLAADDVLRQLHRVVVPHPIEFERRHSETPSITDTLSSVSITLACAYFHVAMRDAKVNP